MKLVEREAPNVPQLYRGAKGYTQQFQASVQNESKTRSTELPGVSCGTPMGIARNPIGARRPPREDKGYIVGFQLDGKSESFSDAVPYKRGFNY